MIPDTSGSALPDEPSIIITPASPAFFSERIHSLDVLRGIAILGALFISIWFFGGFSANEQNGLLLQSKGGNYRLWGTVDLLLNGKMRALISLVFGAGMVLFLSRKNSINETPVSDLFIRRQMWLMGFGLLNALVFLWSGDILFHLGVMGILLFPFVRFSSRSLLIASIIATLIFAGKNYWNYADDRTAYSKYTAVINYEKKLSKDSLLAAQNKLAVNNQKKDSLSKQQKEDKSAWEGIVASKKYDVKKNEDGLKEMRNGSFGKVWDYVLPTIQSREAQWTYTTGIWDLGGIILLGMALIKFGFLNTSFSRKKYLMIALAAIVVGLLLGWFRLQYHQYALHDYAKYVTGHRLPYDLFFPIERALLALGYTSLVLLMIRAGVLKFLWKSLAAAGKMALTNYLLQSILCSLFFAGFGFGYFGRLEQYQLYLVAAEICLIEIAFSIFWLRIYRYGPAEWLLRCLMYKKWLPNKLSGYKESSPTLIPYADELKLN
ncbi:MAG: DUF418 domain-containing protein [Ferruginibacter sp.]